MFITPLQRKKIRERFRKMKILRTTDCADDADAFLTEGRVGAAPMNRGHAVIGSRCANVGARRSPRTRHGERAVVDALPVRVIRERSALAARHKRQSRDGQRRERREPREFQIAGSISSAGKLLITNASKRGLPRSGSSGKVCTP